MFLLRFDSIFDTIGIKIFFCVLGFFLCFGAIGGSFWFKCDSGVADQSLPVTRIYHHRENFPSHYTKALVDQNKSKLTKIQISMGKLGGTANAISSFSLTLSHPSAHIPF